MDFNHFTLKVTYIVFYTGYTGDISNSSFGNLRMDSRHVCKVCGKHFPWRSTLVTHMLVHTGERPFRCVKCGKGFAQKGNLKMHMTTHK